MNSDEIVYLIVVGTISTMIITWAGVAAYWAVCAIKDHYDF